MDAGTSVAGHKHSSVAWTGSTVGEGTDISIVVELDRKAHAPEDSDEYESAVAEVERWRTRGEGGTRTAREDRA
jgi:hypothetical protein